MATYTVRPKQNIFDVALLLHGNIEGVFDLILSNKTIRRADGTVCRFGMATDLLAGDTLEYHDNHVVNRTVTERILSQNYIPANGERHVYHKGTEEELAIAFAIAAEEKRAAFTASGTGTVVIDWGDNSGLQTVELSDAPASFGHYFDSEVSERRVRMYGCDFAFSLFDASGMAGMMCPAREIRVEKFMCLKNIFPLAGLMLFKDTYFIDMRGSTITDLTPIVGMWLRELDIRDSEIDSGVIDKYLVDIVLNYGDRPPCEMRMSVAPTEVGMAAIRSIINNDAWNHDGAWRFDINGTIYTRE